MYKIKVLFLPEEIQHFMYIKQSSSEQYELITLYSGPFTPELADEIDLICQVLREQGRSVIIDAQGIDSTLSGSLDGLCEWQNAAYAHKTSWVMAGLKKNLWPEASDVALNLTPTLEEAIDIVAMEIIERELLGDDF